MNFCKLARAATKRCEASHLSDLMRLRDASASWLLPMYYELTYTFECYIILCNGSSASRHGHVNFLSKG